MRRLVVLAALTGCPAPPAPPPERPAPPPPVVVAPIDAAPAPVVPAVVAARAGRDRLEVIRIDADGETRVLHELQRSAGLPRVADLAVDGATGRYAILAEVDRVDGDPPGTPRDVMSLVLGSLDGGAVAVGPGDRKCVMHRCFENQVAIGPGGDTVVTTLRRSSSSDLAQYAYGATPRPTRLTAKLGERPALSPDQRRVASVRGGAIHLADLGASTSAPLVAGVKDVVAIALGDAHVAYRTGRGAVVIVDVETGAASAAGSLAADPRPPLRLAGDEVFTTDGGSVVAAARDGGQWRVIASGVLIDVSPDGRWLLVDDGALMVVSAADGRVWARHDVPAAFGEVRARLAP